MIEYNYVTFFYLYIIDNDLISQAVEFKSIKAQQNEDSITTKLFKNK